MAIKIVKADYKYDIKPNSYYDCAVLADTEDEIAALSEIVDDGSRKVAVLPGSRAATADGTAKYIFSPSKVWTKVGG